jgi:hypothetical protein
MAAPHTTRTGVPVSVTVIVIIGTLITVVGGLVAWLHPATLIPAGSPLSHGVDLYGQRMAARNLALGVALTVFLAARAPRPLATVMAVVVLVEIGDTIGAIVNADWAEASGVLIAAAFAWAAGRLLGAPAWRPASYLRLPPGTRMARRPAPEVAAAVATACRRRAPRLRWWSPGFRTRRSPTSTHIPRTRRSAATRAPASAGRTTG